MIPNQPPHSPVSNLTAELVPPTHAPRFGTGAVFLASFSSIIGAIFFLRTGYAIGQTGLMGFFAIMLLAHAVTIPTALAISEIATNRRVEGGGEYFMLSRSFGQTIGGTIGISLFFSQAISVGFYMAAFAEAFRPLQPLFETYLGFYDPRLISIPTAILMGVLALLKGASLGMRVLWIATGIQMIAILFFFLGGPPADVDIDRVHFFSAIENPHAFMLVFAICFPGFTGMTAGVGLSGDLENPRKSIPLGVMSATFVAMAVYILLALKLSWSATPDMLVNDQLVMSSIAIWGPIIFIGLGCAALSSSIGSILVAPRTLQALGQDGFSPSARFNTFVSHGIGAENEPRNANMIVVAVAMGIVMVGSIDSIARIVSMFFMVTYGSLCAISFLEHFAARPSYRPAFKSRWYISLLGSFMCYMLMFLMDPIYAAIAVFLIIGLYFFLRNAKKGEGDTGIASLLEGAMAQATRYLQIRLRKNEPTDWRPSIIMISDKTSERGMPMQLLSWLTTSYGFGTYIHFIPGRLDRESFVKSKEFMRQLQKDPLIKESNIFVDTMVSPSLFSALAQTLQLPGVSGVENNTILFNIAMHDDPETLKEFLNSCQLAAAPGLNRLVLRHSEHSFGNRRIIHIWLTWHDFKNASLMILLAYILVSHPDWEKAEISIYAAYPESKVIERSRELHTMIQEGRIPVHSRNIEIVPTTDQSDFQQLVYNRSHNANLVIFGFVQHKLDEHGSSLFLRHPKLREVLFVNAEEEIIID